MKECPPLLVVDEWRGRPYGAVNPISFHFVVPRPFHARGDGSAARGRAAGKLPIVFCELRPNDFQKTKGNCRFFEGHIPRTVAFKNKNHEPDIFGIVSLPTAQVARSLHLNALVTMKTGVLLEEAGRDKVRMSIVVVVFYHRFAMFWDGRGHELAHDTAEVRSHQKGFEPLDFLGTERLVDEAQEVEIVPHRAANMLGHESVRELGIRIKPVRVE